MIGPKQPQQTAKEESAAYDMVTTRDEGRCTRCHRAGDVSRDHRVGRGVGGRTVVENLQLLCGTGTTGCHGWKTAHPEFAMSEGWSVPSWSDPAYYPARRCINPHGMNVLIWVIYNPDGTWNEISAAEAAARIEGTY